MCRIINRYIAMSISVYVQSCNRKISQYICCIMLYRWEESYVDNIIGIYA
jgi:hypothetical protein